MLGPAVVDWEVTGVCGDGPPTEENLDTSDACGAAAEEDASSHISGAKEKKSDRI